MQRGFSGIFILIGTLVLAITLGGGYYFFNQQKIASIKNFDDCAKYYPVMLSYPGQCNTPDGRHFVQELSEEEKKKLVPPTEPRGMVCTMDAKICPDGSSVGRSGPNCEFAKCPSSEASESAKNMGWKIYKNNLLGIQFEYPSEFSYTEIDNRGGSSSVVQDIITFKSGEKEFSLDRTSSDGRVLPYMETQVVKEFNKLSWKVFTPDKDDQFCDAGMCGNLSPSYYMFRDGYMYNFVYRSDDLKPVIEKVLESFQLLASR